MPDKDINKDPLLSQILRDIFALSKTKELEELLNKGLNPNHKFTYNNVKYTLLTLATKKNLLSFVKLLIEFKADIDLKDEEGWNPLLDASSHSHIDIVSYLLSKGANINVVNKAGYSPLMLACELDLTWEIDIVKLLVEHGADVNFQAEDGYTALNLACFSGLREAIDYLLSKGADVNLASNNNITCLMNLSFIDSEDGVTYLKKLISHGAKINEVGKNHWSALTYASKLAYPDAVMFLLLCGATIRPIDIQLASTDKKKKILTDWESSEGDI